MGRWELAGGFITGTDLNPDGLQGGTPEQRERTHAAWFGEVAVAAYPWLYPAVRIGGAQSEQNGDDLDRFVTISPSLTVLARANVRLTLEALVHVARDRTVGGTTVSPTGTEAERLKWIKTDLLFAF